MKWMLIAMLAAPAAAQDVDAQARALADALSGIDPAAESRRIGAEAEASMAMARLRAQEPVRDRLAQACGTLFAAEPDRTITNPLCLDVFLANGLPAVPSQPSRP